MKQQSDIQQNRQPTSQGVPAGSSVVVNFLFMVIFMAALSTFGSFVNDMYLPSLPAMTTFFHCSVPMVQLGLTTGMIGLGVGQIVLGPMSDRYGRKPVLVGSLVLFIIAAVISIFSPTIHFFLICRFFQGLGASGGYFLARTIPTDVYGGRQLAKTMALIGAINGFAPACAPVLGGFVTHSFHWQGVFVFLALFALVLVVVSRKLKETLPASRRVHGSLAHTFGSYVILLRNRRFMTHSMLKGSALGILFAYIASAPFIMQTHYGYSEIEFGLFMGFNALFVGAGAMLALRFHILKKAGFVGALILLAAMIGEGIVLLFTDSFWAYELLLLPVMLSMGMIFTVGNTLAMNEGKADAGGASAVIGILGYIFGAVVSPLVGMGNILHSTAYVFLVVTLIVLFFAVLSKRIPADLDAPQQ